MKNHLFYTGMAVALLMIGFVSKSSAIELLTKDAALKQMFPDAEKVTPEVKNMSPEQIAAVKARLGGHLVHFQVGAQSAEVKEKTELTFYVATKGGSTTGVALIEEQPGKWGPVVFIIAVDPVAMKVKNMAVMSYVEKRGRPIARANFLDQFLGKGTSDQIAVRKDIRAISGATISSDCTCFAVKKVLVLCETMYGKK